MMLAIAEQASLATIEKKTTDSLSLAAVDVASETSGGKTSPATAAAAAFTNLRMFLAESSNEIDVAVGRISAYSESPPDGPTSPDGMDLVKLVVLGSPGVGKTSLIRQFMYNDFREEHSQTSAKQTYYPSLIINEHVYEVKLVDVPALPYFPVSTLYEWTDFRFYGLRNATAYVLVFDLANDDTFAYIRKLREQIIESRNMHHVPIFVVGNKRDLAPGGDGDVAEVRRRDLMSLVRKSWKCGYIECSAKYNWHVVALFKELMKTIDYIDYGQKPTTGRAALHEAFRRQKCVIL